MTRRRRIPTKRPHLETLENRVVMDGSGVYLQNAADPFDVNDDGSVNVADLNAMNQAMRTVRQGGTPATGYYDITGDGSLTPNDLQSLLGELRRLNPGGGRPTPPPPPGAKPLPPRSYDGTGNNLAHPEWGSTGEQFIRRDTADYADGISAPAGADRPSPREISNIVNDQDESILNNRRLSDMVWQWGQFVDHDLDLTLNQSGDSAESLPIAVPTGDPYFDPTGTGTATIGLTRSVYDPTTGTSTDNPREQTNAITAYIDGSQVYGSSQETADSLRTFAGGQMKTSAGDLLPTDDTGFFQAGDIRVNEQIGLISMQTLWVREHNRIATAIAEREPTLTDEEVFQRARTLVIGELQAITYKEFLPALLGRDPLRPYMGYKADVNTDIGNVFATASYRFGHSMLSSQLLRLNNDGTEADEGNIALQNAFFNPSEVTNNGIDSVLKGLATQQAQEIDVHLVDDVRNFLFGPPGAGGFDLASLNIQRGRDHGLPSYNEARVQYGLRPVTSFAQITHDPAVQAKLQQAYGDVDSIDAWVGGLAEDHVPGASVGPLVRNVLADQFTRLRDGDRYWYQNALRGQELDLVEHTPLADVIRRNTDITNLQPSVFWVPRAADATQPTTPPTGGGQPLPPPPPPPPTGGTQQPTTPPTGGTTTPPPPPPTGGTQQPTTPPTGGTTTPPPPPPSGGTQQPTTPPAGGTTTPPPPPPTGQRPTTSPTAPTGGSTTTPPTGGTSSGGNRLPLPPPPPPPGANTTTGTTTTAPKPASNTQFAAAADELFTVLGSPLRS